MSKIIRISVLVLSLAFGFILLSLESAQARAVVGTLKSCNDGDTCRFNTIEGVINVRFSGVEAPELDQSFGKESRDYLINLLSGASVELDCDGSHGQRRICFVYLNGADVGGLMIRAGMALEATNFSENRYNEDQSEARSTRRGMWNVRGQRSALCYKFDIPECDRDPMFQR